MHLCPYSTGTHITVAKPQGRAVSVQLRIEEHEIVHGYAEIRNNTVAGIPVCYFVPGAAVRVGRGDIVSRNRSAAGQSQLHHKLSCLRPPSSR
jgi:hypothetical protein